MVAMVAMVAILGRLVRVRCDQFLSRLRAYGARPGLRKGDEELRSGVNC
jgi:hypothetical protein